MRAPIPGRGSLLVFWVAGRAPSEAFAMLEDSRRHSIESFRDLSLADRLRIREGRLHVVRARQGDLLGQVLERHGSRWDPEAAAVANGVRADEAPGAGRPIEITIPTPCEG